MEIFTRWGELIYKSSDSDAKWDGKHKGKECFSGVYVYVISAGSAEGTETYTGDVTLLR